MEDDSEELPTAIEEDNQGAAEGEEGAEGGEESVEEEEEEEEYTEEEEYAEEEDPESASGSDEEKSTTSSKRKSTDSEKRIADLEAENKRLREENPALRSDERKRTDSQKRIADLEAENKHLREENLALRSDVFTQLTNIRRGQESMVRVFSVYSGMSAELASDGISSASTLGTIEGIKLQQIFGFGDGTVTENDSIDSVAAPKRFKAAGSFPHAVSLHKRTGTRQYEVEGRRQVVMKFRLVYKLDGNPASERIVRSDGMLPFKMTILYADNGEEVQRDDFDRLCIPNLTDPVLEHIDTRQMMNSEVVFKWDVFRARSSDTNPKAREFMVKVTPHITELKHHPDLTLTTPPFVVLSKVTARS